MPSCIASSIIVRIFFGYSAYEMKLLKQGINVVRGHDAGILRNLLVKDFRKDNFEVIYDSTPVLKIVDKAIQSFYPHFVVLNQKMNLQVFYH